MHLTIDFETRSCCDLEKKGLYNYAKDSTTELLCAAVKVDDTKTKIYVPDEFRQYLLGIPVTVIDKNEYKKLLESATRIEAHNANFERVLHNKCFADKYGLPKIPTEKFYCSMAKCAQFAIPLGLGKAAMALQLNQKKDTIGAGIMRQMSTPVRIESELTRGLFGESEEIRWHITPRDYSRLCLYCVQDVNVEYEISTFFEKLTPAETDDSEREIYLMDCKINDRGFKLDVKSAINIKEKVASKDNAMLLKIPALTNGRIQTANQSVEIVRWLNELGFKTDSSDKDAVSTLLERSDLPDNVREFLKIKQEISKSSVAKLEAIENLTGEDHRLRYGFQYHGAATGRWAGRGFQPHNLPKSKFTEEHLNFLVSHSVSEIELLYDGVHTAASKSLRPLIIPDAGKTFFGADFASIESRVLGWITGEERINDAYAAGKDVYRVAAASIYNRTYEDIAKESLERTIGKVATLALGYGGGSKAFLDMGKTYGVSIPVYEAETIKRAWRKAHPKVVLFWDKIEAACVHTLKTGEESGYRMLKTRMNGDFLQILLPSGRPVSYYKAHLRRVKVRFFHCECGQSGALRGAQCACINCGSRKLRINEELKDALFYLGEKSNAKAGHGKKFTIIDTHGGKLTENIDQAISCDLLKHCMLSAEKHDYPVAMHVHDEVLVEVEPDKCFETFEKIMCSSPSWAEGLLMGIDSWRGNRYLK